MLDWFVVNGVVNESQLRGGLVAVSWPMRFLSTLALYPGVLQKSLFPLAHVLPGDLDLRVVEYSRSTSGAHALFWG